MFVCLLILCILIFSYSLYYIFTLDDTSKHACQEPFTQEQKISAILHDKETVGLRSKKETAGNSNSNAQQVPTVQKVDLSFVKTRLPIKINMD